MRPSLPGLRSCVWGYVALGCRSELRVARVVSRPLLHLALSRVRGAVKRLCSPWSSGRASWAIPASVAQVARFHVGLFGWLPCMPEVKALYMESSQKWLRVVHRRHTLCDVPKQPGYGFSPALAGTERALTKRAFQ